MKKLLALLLSVTMLLSMTACGGKNVEVTIPAGQTTEDAAGDAGGEKNAEVTTPAGQTTEDAAGDAGGEKNAEVTIPAGQMTEDADEEALRKEAEEAGFESVTLNEDGSVTYTMTAKKQKEVREKLAITMDESVEALLNGEDAVESFERIEYTDDLAEITIYADQEAFESSMDALSMLILFSVSVNYQLFGGVPPEEVDVVIHMVNVGTEEEFDTLSYQDMMKEAEAE